MGEAHRCQSPTPRTQGRGRARIGQGATEPLPDSISEKDYLQLIRDAAHVLDWPLVYHTYLSLRSLAGFPDLALARDGVLIFFEVKSARGRIRPEQVQWIKALDSVPGVGAWIVRPKDWPFLLSVLGNPHPHLDNGGNGA